MRFVLVLIFVVLWFAGDGSSDSLLFLCACGINGGLRDVHFMDAIDKYLIKCQADNLKSETIRDKARHLFLFSQKAEKPLDKVSLDELYAVISKTFVEVESDCVKRKMTRDLRAFFKYLNESNKSKVIYTAIKNHHYSERVRPRMTEEEYLKLLSTCNDLIKHDKNRCYGKFRGKNIYLLWKCAIEIMYSSGVRVNELVSIKMEDLVTEEQTFMVLGKFKKWRQCWYDCDLSPYLKEFEPTELLFPVHPKSIRYGLQTLCQKAGIRPLSPHTCRHAFCSDMVQTGMDILTVCTLTGHSKVQTLYDHYWHPAKLKENWDKRKLPHSKP